MGFCGPSTHTETGSDLHRNYLNRLCCAFRLSQPLDALFRPRPLRPCFMPVTPLGFDLQRFSLPGSDPRLSARAALHAVPNGRVRRLPGRLDPRPRLRGFAHPRSPYPQGGVTRYLLADPLMVFTSSRFAPTRPRPRASTKPPLMGFAQRRTGIRPSLCSLFRVSKNRAVSAPLSRRTNPLEVPILIAPPPR
jgi:hypothetical protein